MTKQREIKFKVIVLSKIDGKLIEISEPLELEDIGFYLRKRRDKDRDCIEYYEYSQDTGLKDKHGKEIYKGDILKSIAKHSGDKGYDGVSQVVWKQEEARWELKKDRCLPISWYGSVEVVGNIYENRELLKN